MIDADTLATDVALDDTLGGWLFIGGKTLTPSPIPRRHELPAPYSLTRLLGCFLVPHVVLREAPIGQRPAVGYHPPVYVRSFRSRQTTHGHDALVSVYVELLADNPVLPDPLRQGKRGIGSTAPSLAILKACLFCFRGVYAMEADTLTTDLKGVAIYDAGFTRDASVGIQREQNYQYGNDAINHERLCSYPGCDIPYS